MKLVVSTNEAMGVIERVATTPAAEMIEVCVLSTLEHLRLTVLILISSKGMTVISNEPDIAPSNETLNSDPTITPPVN